MFHQGAYSQQDSVKLMEWYYRGYLLLLWENLIQPIRYIEHCNQEENRIFHEAQSLVWHRMEFMEYYAYRYRQYIEPMKMKDQELARCIVHFLQEFGTYLDQKKYSVQYWCWLRSIQHVSLEWYFHNDLGERISDFIILRYWWYTLVLLPWE